MRHQTAERSYSAQALSLSLGVSLCRIDGEWHMVSRDSEGTLIAEPVPPGFASNLNSPRYNAAKQVAQSAPSAVCK